MGVLLILQKIVSLFARIRKADGVMTAPDCGCLRRRAAARCPRMPGSFMHLGVIIVKTWLYGT